MKQKRKGKVYEKIYNSHTFLKIRHMRVNSKQISSAGNLLGMLSYFGTKSIYNFLPSLKKKHLLFILVP